MAVSKLEQQPSALAIGAQRVDRSAQEIRRRGRAREMHHPVQLAGDIQWLGYVPLNEVKPIVGLELDQIPCAAGAHIVNAKDIVAVGHEPVGEVAADESGGAGQEDAHALTAGS